MFIFFKIVSNVIASFYFHLNVKIILSVSTKFSQDFEWGFGVDQFEETDIKVIKLRVILAMYESSSEKPYALYFDFTSSL